MEANELRQLSVEELKGRVKQFKEELVRSRFKVQTAESRDTSIARKTKTNIARVLTVLAEKARGVEIPVKKVEDKPVKNPAKSAKGSK